MKSLLYMCAALLMAAGFATSASAATYEDTQNLVAAPAVKSEAATREHIKVADGFGAGLVTGIIGSVVVGKIIKHKRHHGYRYHRSRHYGGCRHWSRRCARNWGYGGKNYRGCMRYHGCY